MIKKLLSVVAVTVTTIGAINAQSQFVAQPAEFNPANKSYNVTHATVNEKTSAALVQDTLWYFYKKHVYRNASGTGFYTYQSPGGGVTHMGSRFANTGTITVTGLEGIASRNGEGVTGVPSLHLPSRKVCVKTQCLKQCRFSWQVLG